MKDKFEFQEIQSWEPISVIKERVLDRTLLLGTFLALLAFTLGSVLLPTYAFSPGFFLDIGSISGLILIYIFRNRIQLRFKLSLIMILVYSLFFTSLTQYGTVSTQLTLAVLVPFLSVLAFSFRISLMVLAGVILSFTLVASLYLTGILESRIYNPLNNWSTIWTTSGIVLSVTCSVIVLMMNHYNKEMNLVIDKLKKRDKEMTGHLDEKNVMIQEIHHRVKNNLAVVSGLLELQVMGLENPDVKEIMQKSVNRILSIAKVHEMLYQSENFNQIRFKEYVDELARVILQSMNSEQLDINYESQIETDFLSINQGVPLGIIFNELITNSIKYGLKPGSDNQINIRVNTKDGLIHAIYEDNGIGIENFEEASSKSLGFSLIESLLSQINAEYEFQTDDGFKLSFSFPP